MDQVHVIRHKVLVEGQSARSVARQMRVSRNTVRKYLLESAPKRQESRPRARPVLEAVAARMEALLEQWSLRSTTKQRVTGSRLHQELVEEGFQVGVTTVRTYLRERRRQAAEVFVPLVHRPGEGQVDFFEVTVDQGGERRKAWNFLLRLMYSGRDFVCSTSVVISCLSSMGTYGPSPCSVACQDDWFTTICLRRSNGGLGASVS